MPEIRSLALAMLVLLAVACGVPIDSHSVPGTYYWNTAGVVDEIIIRPDSTYVHVFVPRDGPAIRDSSTWDFETWDDGAPRVSFDHFRFYSREGDWPRPVPQPAIWPATIERGMDGRLRLSVDPDVDLYYVRK